MYHKSSLEILSLYADQQERMEYQFAVHFTIFRITAVSNALLDTLTRIIITLALRHVVNQRMDLCVGVCVIVLGKTVTT